MKVLLTGATGFIGKELGKALTAKGHDVVSVSRSADKAKKELPYRTEVVEWDGESAFPISALTGIEGVIHFMGEGISDSRWSSSVKKRLVDSRVQSSLRLKEAFASSSSKLKFWLQGSAIGYYGDSDQGEPFTEDSAAGSGFLEDLCVEWEAAAQKGAAVAERFVVLRTGVVFSHQGGAFEKMMTPLMAGVGGVVGSGEQRMSVIHLEDQVRFMVHAVENESVRGAYNLVCETPITQKAVIHQLARELGIKPGLSIPGFAIKLALGEMGSLLLQDQAVISLRMKESGFALKYPRAEDILREVVQWHKSPVEDTPAYLVYSEQFIPSPVEKVFGFFSDAKNLEKITPEWLHFQVAKMSTDSIGEGSVIDYELKLHGIPLKWETLIPVWDPPRRFVDRQMKGPYHLWYHEHFFEAVPGGTLMKDWVRFQLPLGKAGLVGLPKVSGDVKAIFAHRTDKIKELFNY